SMLQNAAAAAAEASRSLDPDEEYLVGRAVAATVFSSYPPYDSPRLNEYINFLGQGLALYSAKPEIYAGYRFFVLDSFEVNAFATPGGHILITRGALALVGSEDELAALLAHEIAHVALGHGLDSVRGMRFAEIASHYAISSGLSAEGASREFTENFGPAIAELAKILFIGGYSQTFEIQADAEAGRILAEAGYDAQALKSLISKLREPEGGKAGQGIAFTHPAPLTRLQALADSGIAEAAAAGNAAVAAAPSGFRVLPLLPGSALARPPAEIKEARAARFLAMKELF
ncbi:MAG TPA: M48 family metalloprotease, partial [Rectinemataceae bacterium]